MGAKFNCRSFGKKIAPIGTTPQAWGFAPWSDSGIVESGTRAFSALLKFKTLMTQN